PARTVRPSRTVPGRARTPRHTDRDRPSRRPPSSPPMTDSAPSNRGFVLQTGPPDGPNLWIQCRNLSERYYQKQFHYIYLLFPSPGIYIYAPGAHRDRVDAFPMAESEPAPIVLLPDRPALGPGPGPSLRPLNAEGTAVPPPTPPAG